jgi:hypothetical protein
MSAFDPKRTSGLGRFDGKAMRWQRAQVLSGRFDLGVGLELLIDGLSEHAATKARFRWLVS